MDKIMCGDVIEMLKKLDSESVQCCITSPPYWGLRDYGHIGQLGLEKTPEEYVAKMVEVFREVKRVLRKDGTLWLNLGDSYAGSGRGRDSQETNVGAITGRAINSKSLSKKTIEAGAIGNAWVKPPRGYKAKDLIGIPWSVAKALQEPYYTGRVKSDRDRIYLAATIDAEGSICGFTHKRKNNGDIRRGLMAGIHVTITNSNTLMLDECFRIWKTSRQDHNAHGKGHFGKLDTFRWIAHGVEDKAQLMAEMYPYLICKKKQAMLAWNFLKISEVARGRNKGADGDTNRNRCAWIVDALSKLNHLNPVDIPSWIKEPPSQFEDGYYLRQDIIWAKPNPMPESVTDRCTKSHEYIFLLTKSGKYYYDADAIKEEAAYDGRKDEMMKGSQKYKNGYVPNQSAQTLANRGHARWDKNEDGLRVRNKRDVWTVNNSPYPGAHFATFPEEIPILCIKAGTKEGDTVLDPFAGSGTTLEVAKRLGRDYIGIELNRAYVETLILPRLQNVSPLFDKSERQPAI